jgi:hypothetical protein
MAPSKRVSLAFLLAFAIIAGAALQPSAAARNVATAVNADQESSTPQPPSAGAGGWQFPALPPLPSFPCIPGLPQLPWLPPCNNASTPMPPRPSFPCIPGMPQLPWMPPCNNASHGGAGPSPLPPRPSFPCIPGIPRLPWMPPCNNASHGGGAGPSPLPPAPPQPAECGTPLAAMMTCADFLTKNDVTAPPAACCDGLKAVVKDAPICMCHVVNRDFAKLLPAPMLRLRMTMLPRVCGAAMPFATLRQCISKS